MWFGSRCVTCPPSPDAHGQLKSKGNGHFKQQQYAEAAVWYRKGIYYSAFDESQFNFELQDIHREQVCNVQQRAVCLRHHPFPQRLSAAALASTQHLVRPSHAPSTCRDQVCKVVVPLRLNYALCLLKDSYRPLRVPLPSLEGRYAEAIENCNEVLAMFKNKEAELKMQVQCVCVRSNGVGRAKGRRMANVGAARPFCFSVFAPTGGMCGVAWCGERRRWFGPRIWSCWVICDDSLCILWGSAGGGSGEGPLPARPGPDRC